MRKQIQKEKMLFALFVEMAVTEMPNTQVIQSVQGKVLKNIQNAYCNKQK